ncbi:hypothetical protein QQS21_006469 [Conoideocrella luteorostrata]|uniref:Uncharacterized protein n=1 Tax=Conoideocrella luteorostrata TaxID=1105319 RepID=A0AAJ0CMQ0_9HYPO|nr:hypothetical protein QQS21_006469 [Conoideocrella luteorostrata]
MSRDAYQLVQTSHGIYERDLDGLEKFLDFISSVGQGRPEKSNWCCFSGIKVATHRYKDEFISDVREAWKTLRLELPAFSAIIHNGRWRYRSAAVGDEWDSWLDETFHVHETDSSARQLFPMADVKIPQRVTLHVFPLTQEVLLMAPHTHVDGLGMAIFMDQLLHQLVTPRKSHVQQPHGDESGNLMPSVAVAAQVPSQMTPSQQKTYNDSIQDFFRDGSSIKLAARDANLPARRTKLRWMSLNSEETTKLAARCRELGISVTSAMQAALGRTCRLQSGQSENFRHCNMAIYDARFKHIDRKRYPLERLVGSNIFVMPALFHHPPNQSFTDSAKAAKAEFQRFLEDNVVRAASQNFGPDCIRMLASAAASDCGAEPEATPADLNHSSLGIMDKWVKNLYQSEEEDGRSDIEVKDLWFALDLLHPNILVDTWTFGGKFNVELIYNVTFHSEESISLICSLIWEQLTQGLCLDLDFDVRSPGQEEWI